MSMLQGNMRKAASHRTNHPDVSPRDIVKVQHLKFIRNTHSIPTAQSWRSPLQCDFFTHFNSINALDANTHIQRMAHYGEQGCSAWFSDSTNAELPGSTSRAPSEPGSQLPKPKSGIVTTSPGPCTRFRYSRTP